MYQYDVMLGFLSAIAALALAAYIARWVPKWQRAREFGATKPKFRLTEVNAMKSVLLYAVVFSMVINAVALDENPGWGKPVAGIQCRIRTTKAAFTNNEDIVVEFSVMNVSKTNIFFFKGGFEHFLHLTLDGNYIRRADYLSDIEVGEVKESFALIEPGRIWTARVNVTKNWLPEVPLRSGKIAMRYFNPRKNGHAIGIAGWTGTIDSNHFGLIIKN